MTQLLKLLLNKHEDLSLTPSIMYQKAGFIWCL